MNEKKAEITEQKKQFINNIFTNSINLLLDLFNNDEFITITKAKVSLTLNNDKKRIEEIEENKKYYLENEIKESKKDNLEIHNIIKEIFKQLETTKDNFKNALDNNKEELQLIIKTIKELKENQEKNKEEIINKNDENKKRKIINKDEDNKQENINKDEDNKQENINKDEDNKEENINKDDDNKEDEDHFIINNFNKKDFIKNLENTETGRILFKKIKVLIRKNDIIEPHLIFNTSLKMKRILNELIKNYTIKEINKVSRDLIISLKGELKEYSNDELNKYIDFINPDTKYKLGVRKTKEN